MKSIPIHIEDDIYKIETARYRYFFLACLSTGLYPHGTDDLEKYELGYLETILEGKFRPGHFQGVCQVMKRLLKIVRPR